MKRLLIGTALAMLAACQGNVTQLGGDGSSVGTAGAAITVTTNECQSAGEGNMTEELTQVPSLCGAIAE